MRMLAFLCLAATCASAEGLSPGVYDVTYRLEVPHVEQFAVDRTVRVCIARANAVPKVLSENNPLAACETKGIALSDGLLTYDILCPGRRNDRSEAHAIFTIASGTFEGRIRMVMGGKNMTFVEVQRAERRGSCDLAAAE